VTIRAFALTTFTTEEIRNKGQQKPLPSDASLIDSRFRRPAKKIESLPTSE
jgi:hypothetical protein